MHKYFHIYIQILKRTNNRKKNSTNHIAYQQNNRKARTERVRKQNTETSLTLKTAQLDISKLAERKSESKSGILVSSGCRQSLVI